MMNGILKHSTGGDGTLRLTFNNVPEGQYDVYVYLSMNGDDVFANVTELIMSPPP